MKIDYFHCLNGYVCTNVHIFIRTLKRYMGLLKCIQSFQLSYDFVCTVASVCAICLYTERHKWKCAFSFFRKNRFNCYDFPSFNDYFLLKICNVVACVPCSLKLFAVLFSVTILTTQATCQQKTICVTMWQCVVLLYHFYREKLIIWYVFIARATAIIFILTRQ